MLAETKVEPKKPEPGYYGIMGETGVGEVWYQWFQTESEAKKWTNETWSHLVETDKRQACRLGEPVVYSEDDVNHVKLLDGSYVYNRTYTEAEELWNRQEHDRELVEHNARKVKNVDQSFDW